MSIYLQELKEKVERTHDLLELIPEIKNFNSYSITCYFSLAEDYVKKLINEKIINPLSNKLKTLSDHKKYSEAFLKEKLDEFINDQKCIPVEFKDKFNSIPYYKKQFNNYKQKIEKELPNNVFFEIKNESINSISKALDEILFIEKHFTKPIKPVIEQIPFKIKETNNKEDNTLRIEDSETYIIGNFPPRGYENKQ